VRPDRGSTGTVQRRVEARRPITSSFSGDQRGVLETPQAPSEAAASSAAVLLRSPTGQRAYRFAGLQGRWPSMWLSGFAASSAAILPAPARQADGWPRSGPVCRFASLPKRPHFHAIRTKAGLPSLGLAQWPACLSFFALRFCVTPSYFLYYPRRQQQLARKIGDGPAEWESTVSPGELPRPRRPRRSRRRGTSHVGGL